MNTFNTFVTVVKLGSFSAAAKKLHRTPSSISKKIGLLEQRLNVQLFDRTTRTLAVTEAGKRYYEHCRDISQRISEAENEVKGLSGEPHGTICITWPNTISSSSIVEVLGAFSATHPNIKIEVNVSNDRLNLIDENIDFAFRMKDLTDSTMVAIELFRMQPIICASSNFVQKNGIPENVQALENMPLLLLNYANVVQQSWKLLAGIKGLNMEDHHRVNDINALHHMAKQGMGAAFIFRHAVEKELAVGSLIDLLPDLELPAQPVYMTYHKFSHMPKKMRVFIDFFKQYYLMK